MTPDRSITLRMTWWEWTLTLIAAGYPAFQGADWAMPLCGCAAGMAFGVWRAVQLLGYLLEHIQAAVGDEDGQ
jgi:hypothetical protein